jgi:tRNA (adenine22-N1)-methyltransferase
MMMTEIHMNEGKLSRRLLGVFNEIPERTRIADIGSDHAYLPCYAYIKGRINGAVAGEIGNGPLQSARAQVKQSGLQDVINVRKGDGLAVIERNEVDVVVIAGMGGTLIASILEAGKERLEGVSRLILQPNIAAVNVRRWLYENDWELAREKIVEEDGKIYEILVAKIGDSSAPYSGDLELALLVGPHLMTEKSTVFRKKWQHECNKWENIYDGLSQAKQTDDIRERKTNLKEKILKVEAMLQ